MYKRWNNCISPTVLVNIEAYTRSKRFHFKLKNFLNFYEKTLVNRKRFTKFFFYEQRKVLNIFKNNSEKAQKI